jgi:excinuclease ABC subunit C
VIDGGKAQLGAALESLNDLNLQGSISVIAIAKRLEEIYFPGDPVPLYLDKKSETLRLIQHIRNEAHRFSISFHRQKRSLEFTRSVLEEIPGFGQKTIEKLYAAFKSYSSIKDASFEDISKIIGTSKARILKDHFRE